MSRGSTVIEWLLRSPCCRDRNGKKPSHRWNGRNTYSHAENPDHELILAVKSQVEFGMPTSLHLRDWPKRLGEPKNGSVGGVTMYLPLVQGQFSGLGVEDGGVAETAYCPELIDRIACEVSVCISLCDEGVSDIVRRHLLESHITICDDHLVLFEVTFVSHGLQLMANNVLAYRSKCSSLV